MPAVAVRGVQKITDHRENPVNTLLARIDNSVQLLGQPVQRRCKLHDVVCHFLGHTVENVASVAVRGVQKITDHRENSVDTLLACIDNRMKLMRREVHGCFELHDVSRDTFGHAVEDVGSVAVSGVQKIMDHREGPINALLACIDNRMKLMRQEVHGGLHAHDIACYTSGHAVENIVSVAMVGAHQLSAHLNHSQDVSLIGHRDA